MTGPENGGDVRVAASGRAGLVTLDRPRQRNALTLPMVRAIAAALRGFAATDGVARIVLASAVPGTFCAGGDIRAVREQVLAGRIDEAMAFFREEFALNLALAESPVEVVALIDGLCMGGGCGLSLHGAWRVVTENAALAMPETRIGYVPDVGASHVLSRLPDGIGLYLALTGAPVGPGDACALGLATHFVPAARLAALRAALADDPGATEAVLDRFEAPVGPGPLWEGRRDIAALFGHGDLDRILHAERAEGAGAWLAGLAGKSPNSLREAARLVREGRGSPLAACLARELEAARRVIAHPDFAEGVRALLVDKDDAPRWSSPLA